MNVRYCLFSIVFCHTSSDSSPNRLILVLRRNLCMKEKLWWCSYYVSNQLNNIIFLQRISHVFLPEKYQNTSESSISIMCGHRPRNTLNCWSTIFTLTGRCCLTAPVTLAFTPSIIIIIKHIECITIHQN